MLDMEAISLEQVTDLVLDNMINKGVLPIELREKVRKAWRSTRQHAGLAIFIPNYSTEMNL